MITIFTPTYNRKEYIYKLYNSLIKQSNYNFEWLVIDDDSSDETDLLMRTLKEDMFPIRYIKMPYNSGKYNLYNVAIEESSGNYFICVDSDDLLTPNAIEIIEKAINMNKKSIGYIFPQISDDYNNSCEWENMDKKLIDIIDTEDIYKIRETAIVFKTDILKAHHFPVNKNETFCPETVLYNSFINDGKFLAINQAFYIGNYLNTGLTKSIQKIWLKNPNNFLLDLKIKYKVYGKYSPWKKNILRFECILEMNAYCWKKKINVLNTTPSKWRSILLFVPGIWFSNFRYREC